MRKLNRWLNLVCLVEAIDIVLIIIALSTSLPAIEDGHRTIEPIPIEMDVANTSLPVTIHQKDIVDTIIPTRQEIDPVDACDPDELILLAKTVHAEAGNQDEYGKRLVAAVILNRVDSDAFPDTISDVILQDGQFARGKRYTKYDMQAVEDEIRCRTDFDITFFKTNGYHEIGNPAYQYGDHYFSTM